MKLERLLEEMLAEYDRRAEFYEIVLKADVLKLLTLLARDYCESMTDGRRDCPLVFGVYR